MFIHNFNPVFIDLHFIEIRWYSLAYIFGIIGGWMYAKRIIKNIKINSNLSYLKLKDFDDFIPYLIIGIIVGGRLGYVFIYNLEYYIKNFQEILYIWQGGMSFHGGLMGVIFATIIYAKKKSIRTFIYLDILACVAPIGFFLGRISNFINGELYGKVTNVAWSVIFPNSENLARHPSQIYEAILEGLILFIILNYLAFKKKLIYSNGTISILFLYFYSIFRFFSEIFREPDQQIGYILYSLSMGQVLSIIMFVTGISIYLIRK